MSEPAPLEGGARSGRGIRSLWGGYLHRCPLGYNPGMRIFGSIAVGLILGVGLSLAACLYLNVNPMPAPAPPPTGLSVILMPTHDIDAGAVASLPPCSGYGAPDAGQLPLKAGHGRTKEYSSDCSLDAIRMGACSRFRCRIGNRAYRYLVATPV
jgi:hypothetical protein